VVQKAVFAEGKKSLSNFAHHLLPFSGQLSAENGFSTGSI
jgi:hypothetical protein